MVSIFRFIVLSTNLVLYLFATCVNARDAIHELNIKDMSDNHPVSKIMQLEAARLLLRRHDKNIKTNNKSSDLENLLEKNEVADVENTENKPYFAFPRSNDELFHEKNRVYRYPRSLGSSRSSSRSRTRTRKNRQRHSEHSDDDHVNEPVDNHAPGDNSAVAGPSSSHHPSGSNGNSGNSNLGGTVSKKQPKPQKVTSILAKILDVYKVDSLDEVSIEGKNIFKDIVAGQKNFLKTRLQNLERNDYNVDDVIKTVDKVFKKINNPNDVNFKNYLNIIEFTATYMSEKVDHLNNLYNDNPQNLAGVVDVGAVQKLSAKDRLREFAKTVSGGLSAGTPNKIPGDVSVDSLGAEIDNIKTQLAGVSMNVDPNFRDTYSAAYHYYKHRNFRAQNRVLSVTEYYDAMKADLDEVKKTDDYAKLLRHEINEVNVERYRPEFGKNTKLVLKLQNDQINVASFYIIE